VIHVDRKRVTAPRSLAGGKAKSAREDARAFFEQPRTERAQLEHTFDATVYRATDVMERLFAVFRDKCAFCESAVGALSPAEVVHLRPVGNTLDLGGSVSPDHYWWLAYDWRNLYLSCSTCARVRGTRFPVRGTRRRPGTDWPELDREDPLLLDPCRDHPEPLLLYFGDGTVVSDDERGRVTCDMFDLNRTALVEARRDTLDRLPDELAAAGENIEPLLDPAREFAGMRRQRILELGGTPSGGATAEVRVVTPKVKRDVGADFVRRQAAKDSYALEVPSQQEGYFAHARHVERIELRNFRVIDELDLFLQLDTISASKDRAPWLMLLGENGLGKSTVLQGVALALLDERARESLGLDASSFVRRGARRATVRVHLTGTSAPIELVARSGSRHFEGDPSLKALVLGYGATRLLPTARHPAIEPPAGTDGLARVENLFDPFTPIGDATSWLLGLDEERFDRVALGLRRLLVLSDDERLVRDRRNGRVLAEGDGTRVPLEAMSAGYQSVVALATDVMKVVLRLWDTPAVAEGIVIVDELGAHLHPSWRMRIVEALRDVFPRSQFLASTHDPLCLRGLHDGEVVVLRHNSEGRVVALDDLPPPDSMRVDQLLASEHFGLGSTVDPEDDALFAEYYLLKAKARPNATERARLAELHAKLDGKELLGTTRRERLIYEATDEYLAKEVDLTDHAEREQLRDETKQRIAAAWKAAAP
jgi:energy-coupling factor transporter ATP-binding protein EcfA2